MKASDVQQMVEQAVRPAADATSIGIAGGALFGYLPPIAAGLSIIWISIQIFDYFETRRKNNKGNK